MPRVISNGSWNDSERIESIQLSSRSRKSTSSSVKSFDFDFFFHEFSCFYLSCRLFNSYHATKRTHWNCRRRRQIIVSFFVNVCRRRQQQPGTEFHGKLCVLVHFFSLSFFYFCGWGALCAVVRLSALQVAFLYSTKKKDNRSFEKTCNCFSFQPVFFLFFTVIDYASLCVSVCNRLGNSLEKSMITTEIWLELETGTWRPVCHLLTEWIITKF